MSVVKSAVDIVKMFQNYPRATVCMIVMAQPLADGMPPMRLCSFGSDNRFTSCDVKNRLKTVQDILKSEGIEVTGYSADGDSRELKVMRQMLQLGVKRKSSNPFTKKATWFAAVDSVQCIPFQDTIHEGAKLRVRLLKTHMLLPFGDNVASVSDILCLMSQVSKDKHLLRECDVRLQDKMNYDAVTRLCRPELRKLLEELIPGSSATCFYLKLMDSITSSFLNKSITPLERIYRIWYSVFCLRYWRNWMKSDDAYPLATHFISLNSYLCAEINAHSLILVILQMHKENTPELFLPWLFGSQACESYFKTTRSCSSVGSSQTNFTLTEFLTSRCRKVLFKNGIKNQFFKMILKISRE
jgi:hypothetical protein